LKSKETLNRILGFDQRSHSEAPYKESKNVCAKGVHDLLQGGEGVEWVCKDQVRA